MANRIHFLVCACKRRATLPGWMRRRTAASVEAMQYLPTTANEVHRLLADWNVVWIPRRERRTAHREPRGMKPAWQDDCVVRGAVGEVWPIRDEVFWRSYSESDRPPRF
jgi:hypothetical protein